MLNLLEFQMQLIKESFDKITSAKGKAKEPEVADCVWANGVPAKALKLLLDPSVVFHIGIKSFQRDCTGVPIPPYDDLFTLCEYLQSRPALTDMDIGVVQQTLQTIHDPALRMYAQDFLCKKITLGVTAKTVNKAVDHEFIPEFRCMLANKYFEHPDKVEGKHFYLTEKLDGIRCLAVCKENDIKFFTRQGQPIEGLWQVEDVLKRIRSRTGSDFVLDGELLYAWRDGLPSKEQYKRTTMLVRKDGPKDGVTLFAFDYLSVEAFESRQCTTPYWERRQMLETIVLNDHTIGVKVLPILYHGNDTSKIIQYLNIQRGLEHEGVMINLADEPYQFTRTNALLKVKVMQDCDLEITGVQEGTGKFAGTLGALICDYKGNPVGVGSGITDEMRREIWANTDKYIGRVATIQYFEETNDADGKLSIRFPVFKELREEGKEVSYS